MRTITTNFERRPAHGSLSVNNKSGRGGARDLARLAGAEKVKIKNIFLKSWFSSQLSLELSQQFVWSEHCTESQLFSVICIFLRDKTTIASIFLSRPFSRVGSTFPLTENFDKSLFNSVTQHPPQAIARVSPSEQGGVDVVPPFLDIPHVLRSLDYEALAFRDRSLAGLGQLVVDQPAGQGGPASQRLNSGAARSSAAVQGGIANTDTTADTVNTSEVREVEVERRTIQTIHDAVLRPRTAPHQH